MTEIKPQIQFPLLDRYKEVFKVTDRTIFAYNGIIYSDYTLPPDLIIHEQTHFKQQEKFGLDTWVERYLTNESFRLEMEIEAYKNQLKSIKDKNLRFAVRMDSVDALTSGLYGSIITREEANQLLK